jgi:RNA recognition motif-containing protein
MRLFVDNMPEGTTEEELRELFEPFGMVSHVLFVEIEGRPRAEVDMPSDDHAARAAENLDGKELRGRTLEVRKTAMTESFL